MKNHKIEKWMALVILILGVVSCVPQVYDLDEFDINLPKSEISGFSPATALVGSEITLQGTNLDDESLKVYIGSTECQIIEKKANSVKVKLPRVIGSDYFTTINSYTARAVSEQKFVPLYPESKVDLASLGDTIFKSAKYTIKGENLDLITEVILSDTTIAIDGTTVKDPSVLVVNFKESNPAKPKLKALEKIAFKSMAGNSLVSKSDIVVLETYPSANLIAVDPKIASTGAEVKFIFDSFVNTLLIKEIKIGGVVSIFTLDEPYILLTIPSDAASTSIEVINVYGVSLKYADGQFITFN